LGLQPGGVTTGLSGSERPEITIQINSLVIRARVGGKTGRVQTGTNPERSIPRPAILLQETQRRQRSGRFIAMDARREINTQDRLNGGTFKRSEIDRTVTKLRQGRK
jgi:hypothetical protein